MKRVTLLTTAALMAAAAYGAFGDVVSSFPITFGPAEGLAWDGRYLWAVGQPDVSCKCITTTGSLVSSFRLGPMSYGYWHGITYDGQYLWTLWLRDFESNAAIERWTTTGSRVSFFSLYCGQRGLAWESPYLWVGRYKVTTSGSVVSTLWPPVYVLEPAWYGHHLWTGNYGHPYVYKITTTGNGTVVASFRVPGGGDYAGGMTFDGNYLWLVAHSVGYCYQVDIDVVDVAPGSFGKVKAIYR